MRQAAGEGRPVCLATGSTLPVAQEVAKRLGFFSAVFASTRDCNLIGEEKARLLVKTYGHKGFDYIGDSPHDIPVWEQARRGMVVGTPPVMKGNVRLIPLSEKNSASKLRVLCKEIRIHQWIKNLLVFVPLIAAHLFTMSSFVECSLAFITVSLCASVIYIINDTLDINDDRAHPRKLLRPLASGTFPLKYVLPVSLFLILCAFSCAALLTAKFLVLLIAYLLCSVAYSLYFKKIVIVDIIVLAWLYILRIILGIEAIGCDFSKWLFFYFFFLFLGLAAIKRLGSLATDIIKTANSRRGWDIRDRQFLLPFSISCGVGSAVVLGIYCNSPMAITHYAHPDYLLAINIIIQYWYQRIVLLANRGIIHDDPLEFALKERINYIIYFIVIILFSLSL